MLCTIGDLVAEVLVQLNSDPQRGEHCPATITHKTFSGAPNVAVVAAGMVGQSRFVGQVGDDLLGRELVQILERSGVDASVSRVGKTGTTVIMEGPDGVQSHLADRGASVSLATPPASVLDGVTWLHFEGSAFVRGPLSESATWLVGEAVDRGIPTSISAVHRSELRGFGKAAFLALLETMKPQVVFGRRASIAGLLGSARYLDGATWTVAVGEPPTRVAGKDGTAFTLRPPPVGGAPVERIDIDAFTAGVVSALSKGEEIRRAISVGHDVAQSTNAASGLEPPKKYT